MNTVTQSRGAHFNLLERLADRIAEMRKRHARNSLYRETLAELSALSERELGDLGINPMSIHQIAREAADAA